MPEISHKLVKYILEINKFSIFKNSSNGLYLVFMRKQKKNLFFSTDSTYVQQHICAWCMNLKKTYFSVPFSFTQVHCNQKIIKKNNSIKNLYSTQHISFILYSQPVFNQMWMWWYNTKLKFVQATKNNWEFNIFFLLSFNSSKRTQPDTLVICHLKHTAIRRNMWLRFFRLESENFFFGLFICLPKCLLDLSIVHTRRVSASLGWKCRMPHYLCWCSRKKKFIFPKNNTRTNNFVV